MVWGALAMGAASLIGGAMSNRANARQARENRNWQEHMSSTSAQRARADFEAAGLNPGLAYGHTAPMGGGGQAQQEDVVSKGIGNALAYRQHQAQIKKLDAETEKTYAEAELAKADASIRTTHEASEPSWREEQIAARRDRLAGFEHQQRMRPMTEEHQRLANRMTSLGIPEREVRAIIASDGAGFYRGMTRDVPETAGAWAEAYRAWRRSEQSKLKHNTQTFVQWAKRNFFNSQHPRNK